MLSAQSSAASYGNVLDLRNLFSLIEFIAWLLFEKDYYETAVSLTMPRTVFTLYKLSDHNDALWFLSKVKPTMTMIPLGINLRP